MTKLESIASSAVRAADKVGASLIIVYTQSGTSTSPPGHVPITSLSPLGHKSHQAHTLMMRPVTAFLDENTCMQAFSLPRTPESSEPQ